MLIWKWLLSETIYIYLKMYAQKIVSACKKHEMKAIKVIFKDTKRVNYTEKKIQSE